MELRRTETDNSLLAMCYLDTGTGNLYSCIGCVQLWGDWNPWDVELP